MGTIMARRKKVGATSYTAVIHKKKGGKVVLTLTETFKNETAAERWIRKTKRALSEKGALDRAVAAQHRTTWADVIGDYCDASPEGFGKTKTANLAYLQRLEFGKLAVNDTDNHDFFRLGQDLLNGVQAPPADPQADCPEHYILKLRKPQTVNSYMATPCRERRLGRIGRRHGHGGIVLSAVQRKSRRHGVQGRPVVPSPRSDRPYSSRSSDGYP